MARLWLLAVGALCVGLLGVGARAGRRAPVLFGQLGLFVVAVELLAWGALAWGWVGPSQRASISPVSPDEIVGIPTVTPVAHYGLPDHLFPARPAGRRDDRRTVVFIGDSFTHGNGVAPADRFAEGVRAGLEAREGVPVDAINLGIPGLDLYSETELYTDYGAAWAPDLVVWTFVVNDLHGGLIDRHAAWVPEAGNDLVEDHSFRPGVGVSDAWSLLRWSIGGRLIEREVLRSYRETLDPAARPEQVAAAREGLAAVVRRTRERGAGFLFVLFPLMHRLEDPPLREEHARVAGWAREAGADVLDLMAVFEGRDASALWVSVRDHHPNAQGHALAAAAIVDALGPIPVAGPAVCAPWPERELALRRALCEDPSDPARALAWAGWQEVREQLGDPHRVNQRTLQRLGAILAWRGADALPEGERARVRAEAEALLRRSR